MVPEELQQCLEDAFGNLEPPCVEELAAADTYYVIAVQVSELTAGRHGGCGCRWEAEPLIRWIGFHQEPISTSGDSAYVQSMQYFLAGVEAVFARGIREGG